jgi:DNA-binding NtrC family response regulator
MTTTVLVLEDEELLLRGIERHLQRRGHEVIACGTVSEATRVLRSGPMPDAVIVDLGLPDGCGLDALSAVEDEGRRPPAIVMTAEASVETALAAVRLRVSDYLLKPFALDALDAALDRILPRSSGIELAAAPSVDPAIAAWRARYAPQMLGESKALLSVFSMLQRVTATDCPILIHGETGTGKELVARAVHASSGRGARPFVAVNCAAMPEALMESELFGHSRGAYTGAAEKRVGRFVAANGGTLFLDEIGEMPLALQAKLLRALQEKQVTPLGENRPIDVDVRVVAATHRNLDELVAEGTFREDLLYRLDVIRVELPALRERGSDLPLLVRGLITDINQRRGARVTDVEPAAMQRLMAYSWPGNVRQLQNVLERAVLLRGEGTVGLDDLPARIRDGEAQAGATGDGPFAVPLLPEQGVDLRDAVERFESALIRQALMRTNWNKNRAASILRLNRTTLVEKLKKRGWLHGEHSVDQGAYEDDLASGRRMAVG